MRISQKLTLSIAIAILAIILITFTTAPFQSDRHNGSTYNKNPDGYGAWYAYMSERGTPIARWQKSSQHFFTDKRFAQKTTLVRVYGSNQSKSIISQERDWLERGNTLILLGISAPVTEAPFATIHNYGSQQVKIETGRREIESEGKLLADRFGGIVWEEKIGKGKVIYAVTSYLAANAYQDFPGNYEFLANLVTAPSERFFIDEYLHGYKDPDAVEEEALSNILSYLAKTPLLPIVIQIAIVLIIAIMAGFRRFGKAIPVENPIGNNSETYIKALAGVLQKADTQDFVVDVISKEEQLQLQNRLGLGKTLLEPEILLSIWQQQQGKDGLDLERLLLKKFRQRRLHDRDLLKWMQAWEKLRNK
jgi:hypothetical protein